MKFKEIVSESEYKDWRSSLPSDEQKIYHALEIALANNIGDSDPSDAVEEIANDYGIDYATLNDIIERQSDGKYHTVYDIAADLWDSVYGEDNGDNPFK